jgi:hypothetical protein
MLPAILLMLAKNQRMRTKAGIKKRIQPIERMKKVNTERW